MNSHRLNDDNNDAPQTPPQTTAIVPWVPKRSLLPKPKPVPVLITPTKKDLHKHSHTSQNKGEYWHLSKKFKASMAYERLNQMPNPLAVEAASSRASSTQPKAATTPTAPKGRPRKKWTGPTLYEPHIQKKLMARAYLRNKHTGIWRSDWWEGMLTKEDYVGIDHFIEEAYNEINARKQAEKKNVQAMTFNAGDQSEDNPPPSSRDTSGGNPAPSNNANLKTPED